MKGHRDFIVHIPKKYQDTVTGKNGSKIHLDKRFSGKELANNLFEVVNTPVNYKGEIKPGCNLLVDPVVVHTQSFQKWGEEQNQYLVDKEKDLYRINPSLIICYSMGEGTQFKGFENNLLCEKVPIEKKELKKIGLIYIPETAEEKVKNTPFLKVVINNDILKSEGVNEEDLVYHSLYGGIDISLRGKEYIWFRNHHIIGKHIKKSA